MTDREARSKKSALPMDARARNASRAILAVVLVMLSLWVARDFLASVVKPAEATNLPRLCP